MARWQWQWVLLDEEDSNGLEILDQYDEEWQLAIMKLQVSTVPRIKHLALAFPDATAQRPSFSPSSVELISIYSSTPVFQYGRREANRVQQLVLEIDSRNKTFAIGSSRESVAILTSDSAVEAAALRLRRVLFPPIEVVYRNFNGRKLIMTTNHYEPYFKVSDPECRHAPVGSCEPMEGIDYSFIKVIAQALNFR